MNVLGFDTCFDCCSAAVLVAEPGRASIVTGERTAMRTGHAEALLPMIARVVDAAGVRLSQIDRLAVTHGPGTFTGTRIGIAAARALALALGKPVITFSSLWGIGVAALPELRKCCNESDAILVAHDAGRGEVYAELIDITARSLYGPFVLAIGDAARLLPSRRLIAVGSGAPLVADAAHIARQTNSLAVPVIELSSMQTNVTPDAAAFVPFACAAALSTQPLTPLYLRAPDAKPPADAALTRVSQ